MHASIRPSRFGAIALCFEQFNDGVIQAAILRAAVAPELDYSLDSDLSRQMEQILTGVFQNAGK